jgi:predicted pyridoxine 5'-phosphate oxidase superfamily flavin-nucleotide-binding protein
MDLLQSYKKKHTNRWRTCYNRIRKATETDGHFTIVYEKNIQTDGHVTFIQKHINR